MVKWTQIEDIKEGDIVLRRNGLKAPPSEIRVLSISVHDTYSVMTWTWEGIGPIGCYYCTDFRKSINVADYGLWHPLTTQQWPL